MAFPAPPPAAKHDRPPVARGSSSALVSNSLKANQLGVAKVVFFTVSAATPLTVVAGVVTTGIAITGLIGTSLAFVLVGLVLGVFAAGYVQMGRRIGNAGAFYTYISRGLAKQAGIGSAWLALMSYNMLQVALYGVMGVTAAPLADQYFGIDAPWWIFALVAWAITTVLGQLKIDLNGSVLAVLLVAEIAAILIYSVAFVADPGPEGVSFATFSPGNLFGPGLGSLLVLALLGFVGFESSAVYSEETRDTARTVRTATYVALALSGGVYAFAAWAMSVGVGPSKLVEASQTQSTELIFSLAADRLGSAAADIGHVLFVTSIMAALISFHNTIGRYAFALGREEVMSSAFGRTNQTGAPYFASGVQSAIGLIVIVVFAVAGLDPLVQLFFYGGTIGGIGVLVLLLLTSLAMIRFFTSNSHDAGTFSAYVAPIASAIMLAVMLVLALLNLDVLLGVRPGHPLTWIVPVGIVVILGLGAVWANYLRTQRPQVYAVIGLGPDSAAARAAGVVE